ncbi:MAG TPA: hypothetical protein VGE66_08680 [Chitinophagaceae bacterium]
MKQYLHPVIILLMTMIGLSISPAAFSQKLLDINLAEWVGSIPVVPAKAHEVHSRFSMPSADGDRFADAVFLNPVYEQAVEWLSELHRERIEKRINENRREQMTYAVQFDDERTKLALRPLVGQEVRRKYAGTSEEGRQLLQQLIQLEAAFDFLSFYKEWDKITKEQMALDAEWNSLAFELERKIPMVQTEWGLQKDDKKQKEVSERLARKKIKDGTSIFTKRQQSWTAYFDKYARAIGTFEQLVAQAKGSNLLRNDPAIKVLLSEVQARAIEAMEKLIWMEFNLVAQGEMLFQDEQILKGYLVEER